MNEEDNKARMRRFFAAVSGKDKSRELLAQFASDEEFIQHVLDFESAFPCYEILAEEMVSEGDKVAVWARFRGEHRGALMGIAPTGRLVTQAGLVLYELQNGKVVRHWMGLDRLELLRQLGVAPG